MSLSLIYAGHEPFVFKSDQPLLRNHRFRSGERTRSALVSGVAILEAADLCMKPKIFRGGKSDGSLRLLGFRNVSFRHALFVAPGDRREVSVSGIIRRSPDFTDGFKTNVSFSDPQREDRGDLAEMTLLYGLEPSVPLAEDRPPAPARFRIMGSRVYRSPWFPHEAIMRVVGSMTVYSDETALVVFNSTVLRSEEGRRIARSPAMPLQLEACIQKGPIGWSS